MAERGGSRFGKDGIRNWKRLGGRSKWRKLSPPRAETLWKKKEN